MSTETGQLQTAALAVMRPLFSFAWRIKTTGLANIPPGPVIFCPNHISVLDSFFIPAALNRRVTFLGKAEYLDDAKTRWLFPALGMIPIDRKGGEAADGSLDAAAAVLQRGEAFAIYPEGTRSRDGFLHKGHTGPARLALRTGAPIVPVAVKGTIEIMPADAKFPKLWRPVSIEFGEPIDPARFETALNKRRALRSMTDEVMFEIGVMSGQEYLHTYATKEASVTDVVVPTARSSAEVLTPRALDRVSA